MVLELNKILSKPEITLFSTISRYNSTIVQSGTMTTRPCCPLSVPPHYRFYRPTNEANIGT